MSKSKMPTRQKQSLLLIESLQDVQLFFPKSSPGFCIMSQKSDYRQQFHLFPRKLLSTKKSTLCTMEFGKV